jgi:intracellular sulfur oxidation DsrE/DsrF family protein
MAAFAGAMAAAGTAARAQSGGAPFQPARHEQDDWMDKLTGKHRVVFDTIVPDGFGNALLYSNNYFIANQSGYNLGNSDLAVIIVARHNSTPFAFNDVIWGKYGEPMSRQINFTDPKTKEAPATNLFNASGYGTALPNLGTQLDALLKRGVHLAVCQMATRATAGSIARATGGNADTIFNEIAANLVANSHLVPAGIVAVNRAQERGYSFVHA